MINNQLYIINDHDFSSFKWIQITFLDTQLRNDFLHEIIYIYHPRPLLFSWYPSSYYHLHVEENGSYSSPMRGNIWFFCLCFFVFRAWINLVDIFASTMHFLENSMIPFFSLLLNRSKYMYITSKEYVNLLIDIEAGSFTCYNEQRRNNHGLANVSVIVWSSLSTFPKRLYHSGCTNLHSHQQSISIFYSPAFVDFGHSHWPEKEFHN